MARVIIFLFILGFIFRLWLVQSVPQPLIYDQSEYLLFSQNILKDGFYVNTSRLYGYPLIIAPFIHFFGPAVRESIQIFQALLDTGSGLLVFLIAGKLWPKSSAGWTGYFLYLFNPFTSAYTGVLLTEVAAIFILELIFYFYIDFWKTKQAGFLVLLALFLGFLPQVRPSFTIFTVIFILILAINLLRSVVSRHKFLYLSLVLFFYLLPYSHNLIGNLREYRTFSPMLVDNAFVKELYISLYVDKALPNGQGGADWKTPLQVQKIWDEFSTPVDEEGRKAMAGKYWNLSLVKIKNDPGQFLETRIKKMSTVWDKGYLFPYVNISSKVLVAAVSCMNIILLLFTVFGLYIAVKNRAKADRQLTVKFIFLTVILFIYISIFHTISTTEDRFSLPAYPYLCLFAGLSVSLILQKTEIYKRINSLIKRDKVERNS